MRFSGTAIILSGLNKTEKTIINYEIFRNSKGDVIGYSGLIFELLKEVQTKSDLKSFLFHIFSFWQMQNDLV